MMQINNTPVILLLMALLFTCVMLTNKIDLKQIIIIIPFRQVDINITTFGSVR